MRVSTENATKTEWAKNCLAYALVEQDSLLIKKEQIPSGGCELLHYHEATFQFFYVLKGKATFFLAESEIVLKSGEGINVFPKQAHKIMNRHQSLLEFLVISSGKIHNDRINLLANDE